jgi:hypothetical protein
MVATFKSSYQFIVWQYITRTLGQVNAWQPVQDTLTIPLLTAKVVGDGSQQTVPDWVRYNSLFLNALANSTATIVTPPVNSATMTAINTSSQVALPLSGSPTTAYVTNFGEFDATVQLGNSTVGAQGPASVFVPAGVTVVIPIVGGATYLAAISAPATTAIGIVCY